jgi:hypothetical protein
MSQNGLDLPAFAEALVYYGHVELICTCNDICSLIEKIGIDETIRLAESDLVTILYEFSNSLIMNESHRVVPHSIVLVNFCADENGNRIRNHHDEISNLVRRKFGIGSIPYQKVKKLTNAIISRPPTPNEVRKLVLEDIRDHNFLNNAMRLSLKSIIPEYPNVNMINFHSFFTDDYFDIKSNIDFTLARKLHPKNQDGDSEITYAILVSPIVKMRSEMFYSGDRMCDIWSDDLQSSLMVSRVSSFVNKIDRGSKNIDRFQEYVFQGRSFRESVESGSVTILDILNYCESRETRKFKKWMIEQRDSSDLLAEYEKARISESSLLKGLPFKAVKYLSLSALGLFLGNAFGPSIIPGLAANAISEGIGDSIFSKLDIGWRPNHWVSESRSRFFR